MTTKTYPAILRALRLPRLAAAMLAGLFLGCGVFAAAPALAQQILVAEGPVYFWRPGSPDWQPAVLNTQLNPGDAIYGGDGATTEVLIGPNDFARLSSHTQLRLLALDSGLMQFYVASGIASFDLRSMPFGQIVAIDTPNASFVLGGSGYYRVDVQPNQTRFTTRRGGTATLSLASGGSRSIVANQEILVVGANQPALQYRVLPSADTWDRWNDARTDYYTSAGVGVVWIDIGRREHRGPPPPHRWEHRDTPVPPGGWVRQDHRPASVPIVVPAPVQIQPTQPIRPPEFDRERGNRDHAREDRGRPDNDRSRPFEDRGRPGDDRGRFGDDRGQHRSHSEQPAASVNVIVRPTEPAAAAPRPVPSTPTVIANPPPRAPTPVAAPAPVPGPVRNSAPAPMPAPAAAPAPGRAQNPDRDEHRHRQDHDDRR
jgi:hypothetical protein